MNPSSKTGLSTENGCRSGGEDFLRLVSRFIRLTPVLSFSFSRSLSFLSEWDGVTLAAAAAPVTAASAPIATLGGGLIKVVARGDSAGAGAGVVANLATTAAGTEAELEVLLDICDLYEAAGTELRTGTLPVAPAPELRGLKALGGSFGGG